MKKFAFALLFLAWASVAHAFPFLVCDPQAGVEYYTLTGLPTAIDASHIPAQADGSLRFDLAVLNLPGPYSVKAKACTTLWGCSVDSSPLDFTRPAPLTVPGHLRLSP